VIERYPRCRIDGTRWILVEATDRVMPEIPASLADFAARELRARGIEIRTGTLLESVEAGAARLSTGERVSTRAVVWTAGVKPPAVVGELGLELSEHGRIAVDPTLRATRRDNVWAIGDAAAVPDPAKGGKEPCPPTAQHAVRQGRLVAANVAATLAGGRVREFRYRTRGVFVDMGQHKAVATAMRIRLRGFPAWFAARTYHLAMIPGVARRLRLMADWTVGLCFGRSSGELGQLGHPPSLAEFAAPAEPEREHEAHAPDRPGSA